VSEAPRPEMTTLPAAPQAAAKKLPVLNGRQGDPQQVIADYLAGKTTRDIARDRFNCTRQALNYWLREHAEEDWRKAQVILAIERKEKAEQDIETAPDALALARARELLRSAQWDLERVCRRIYGQDAPPSDVGRVQIAINLRGPSATTAVQHDVTERVIADHGA